jgi:D-sedoheptulose 7-phosphate isomerase
VESPRQYAASLQEIVSRLPFDDVMGIADILFRAYHEDRAVFVFGNGGSAALASHMACDLGKGITPLPAPGEAGARRLRILSLTDNLPMISAWANDASYEDVFTRQLENFIRPGDIAFALSGSGNSPNILNALRLAREKRGVSVGFSGQGGEMIGLLDYPAVVPSRQMQLVEDCQLIMMHMVFVNLRARLADAQVLREPTPRSFGT